MMIMEAAALSVTMVIWVLWGWSIAYAGTSVGGVFGDPATGFLLKDSMVSDGGVFTSASLNSNNYPVSVDVAFQSAFAMKRCLRPSTAEVIANPYESSKNNKI